MNVLLTDINRLIVEGKLYKMMYIENWLQVQILCLKYKFYLKNSTNFMKLIDRHIVYMIW